MASGEEDRLLQPTSVYSYDDPGETNLRENRYGVHRLLELGGEAFCSTAIHNVDVEFVFEEDHIFKSVRIGGVPNSYTAPVKDALIFISSTKLDRKRLDAFDGLTKEQYDALEGKAEKDEDKSLRPVAFVTVPAFGDSTFPIRRFAFGRFVMVKFLRPHQDNNIDIGHCLFYGIPIPTKMEIVGAPNMGDIKSILSVVKASKTEHDLKSVEKVHKSLEDLLLIDEKSGGWTEFKTRSGIKSGHVARIRRIINKVRAYQIEKRVTSMDSKKVVELLKENPEWIGVLDVSRMNRTKVMRLWKMLQV